MNPRYPSRIYELFSREAQNAFLSQAAHQCASLRGHEHVVEAMRHWQVPFVPTDHWEARERQTQHDIAAWVSLVRESLATPEARDQFHSGLTSSDLVDTALSMALQKATRQISRARANALLAVCQFADDARSLSIRGRTHGQDAEYVSIGRRVAAQAYRLSQVPLEWYPMDKSSGPVGIDGRLGETQVSNRGRLVDPMGDLVALSLAIEQLALDVRLMARAPERLVYTLPSAGQMGSSSMPDKVNPIIAEKLCGLARVIRANARAVQDSTVLWEERDISHSSVERTAMVEAYALTDYCLQQLEKLFSTLKANPDLPAIEVTAVQAYDTLVEHGGLTREQAYREVQVWGPAVALHKVGVAEHVRLIGYDPDSEPHLWEWVRKRAR